MKITKKQITDALGVDVYDLSSKDICVVLRNIETVLDSVAENLENDFESAALGDASNLIQAIRKSIR